MNWINLEVSIIRAPAYVGSNPTERATWFNVLAYAVEQENGGRIIGAASWKDRQWQQACGVTAREVRSACKLLSIEGDDVCVAFYPNDKEHEVRARRIIAKQASEARWSAARNASRNPSMDASRNAEGERKENEKEKGKETKAEQVIEELNLPPDQTNPLGKSPAQLRAEKLFGKRPSTPPDAAERRAWQQAEIVVESTTPDEWTALEAFYAAEDSKDQPLYRRKALAQLLNNWSGEVAKAVKWQSSRSSIAANW